MDGHEHSTIFSRSNLSVHIVFASGTLPIIYIKNDLLPYDESKGLSNLDAVQDHSEEIKNIIKMHSERLKPAYEYFYKQNYDQKLIQEDFENFGREENTKYIALAAKIIKNKLINKITDIL